tara:strand:- start:489 stop:758 length:270 start_codon:yes stop_codon:yes gene_type:complete
MYNKIKSIIFFTILFIFLFFVTFYYFSENNRQQITKNRLGLSNNIEKKISELPLLENDTKNIIEYLSFDVNEKKIKKRYFWELLKNSNE